MLKQVLFQGRDDQGQVHCQPLIDDGLVKVASPSSRSTLHPQIADFVRIVRPSKHGVYVLVNALGAGEIWGSNVNGDYFPERELIHAPSDWEKLSPEKMREAGKRWEYGFPTFMGAHPYKHHVNKDSSRAFGRVEMAVWNPKMRRVELVVYLDRELCKKFDAYDVIEKVERGEFPDVSMGCAPKGTPVFLANGRRVAIETVKEGDEVITHKGRSRRVVSTIVRPHKGVIYHVKAYGHREPLILTGEHPLWLVRGEQTKCRPSSKSVNRGRIQHVCVPGSVELKKGCAGCQTVPKFQFEWVRTDDACEGDYLAVPLPKLDPSVTFTIDQARVLGYYLAEGLVLRTKAGNPMAVQFCTGLHEEQTHQELYTLGERLGVDVTEYDAEDRNGKYINFWDRNLAELCIEHCGEKALTKRLSTSLMGADTDTLQAFLGAYANGDGGSYKGSLYLSTASIELSEQLRLVLARCGMIASVNEIVHKPSNLVQKETIEYQVWVGTDTAWKLGASRLVLGKSERLSSKRFFYEYEGVSYLMTPIESVEEVPYDDDVYNFGVEEDDSYLVEGLAVHNCKVPYDVCSICQHQSKTPKDYCEHARSMMNTILPDGRKVFVRNPKPRFFDISFVFIGADKTAKVMAKLASKGSQVCMGEYCVVPRLSAEVGEMFSKTAAEEGAGGLYDPTLQDGVRGKTHQQMVADAKASNEVYQRRIFPPASLETNRSYDSLVELDAAREKSASRLRKEVTITPRVLGPGIVTWDARLPGRVNPVGHITTRGGAVTSSALDGDLKGLGLGKKMYGEVMRRMPGQQLSSDTQVSDEAKRVWESMKDRKGYKVTKPLLGRPYSRIEDSLTVSLFPQYRGKLPAAAAMPVSSFVQKALNPSKVDKLVNAIGAFLKIGCTQQEKIANDPIKKFIHVQSIPIMLEWLKGETRKYYSKTNPSEVTYTKKMKADYGYFPATLDADGEQLDVYVGPSRDSEFVFIINQLKPDGSHDEQKVMIGYRDEEEAKKSYLDHMPKDRFGSMTRVLISDFKKTHLKDSRAKAKKSKTDGATELQKTAAATCDCHGLGDDCGGSAEKLAEAVFPGTRNAEKSASHKKLSELIKSIPAGPFSKETLPKLEKSEKDIPTDTLNRMGEMNLNQALSTPAMMGIVLKPHEFQRVMLVRIGQRDMADDLDQKGEVFGPSSEIDDALDVSPEHVHHLLKELLQAMGFVKNRSAASKSLAARSKESCLEKAASRKVSDRDILPKLAAAYNGYRRNLVKKAAIIEKFLVTDPQLSSELLEDGMVEAFAGGIGKTASASVLCPNSLAYLSGVHHQNRDFHIADQGVRASLAQMGSLGEALS